MTLYLIFRHGSNTYNQSMCNSCAIDIIEAKNGKEACKIAQEKHTLYHNQRFTYLCESKVMKNKEYIAAWNAVIEERAIKNNE